MNVHNLPLMPFTAFRAIFAAWTHYEPSIHSSVDKPASLGAKGMDSDFNDIFDCQRGVFLETRFIKHDGGTWPSIAQWCDFGSIHPNPALHGSGICLHHSKGEVKLITELWVQY